MRLLAFTIIICSSIFSCSKPVELDLEEFISQPVVNCFFTPEEPFVVHLSKAASQFDTLVQVIDHADVVLFEDDQIIANLPYAGNGYYADSSLFPKAGRLYTLKVYISGFETLSASDSIPTNFSEFEYLGYKQGAWYEEETEFDGMTFKIMDQPGDNFYHVLGRIAFQTRHYSTDSIVHHQRLFELECYDPLVKEANANNMFTDNYFNDSEYVIDLVNTNLSYYVNRDSVNFNFQVIQGSIHYFKYQTILEEHRHTQYADFFNPMEPVIMYSNIENGYGIFAGYHSKIYPVPFIINQN